MVGVGPDGAPACRLRYALTEGSGSDDDVQMGTRSGETVGERLRRLRIERGLSQRELAQVGVSHSYLSRLEQGRRAPSVKALRLLAKPLGVTADYLETGVESGLGETLALDAELELRLGDPGDAIARFSQVLEAAGSPDSELADRGKIGIGLARAALGEHAEAVAVLEPALASSLVSVTDRPDAFAVLGRSYAALGQHPRAIALFRECLATLEAGELVDSVLYVRFATYLAYALMDTGDLAGANSVLADALTRAHDVPDIYTEIRLYWSLGRLHSIQGPVQTATRYAYKAVALLERTEDRFYLARAQEACATSLLDQGEAAEAVAHLEAAQSLYEELDQRPYLASLSVQWARFHLQRGALDEARATALEALDLLDESVADPENPGEAWAVLGQTLAALGEPEFAETALRKGIERLTDGAPVKQLSDAHRAYAEFLEAQGRIAEALAAMRAAADLTTSRRPGAPTV